MIGISKDPYALALSATGGGILVESFDIIVWLLRRSADHLGIGHLGTAVGMDSHQIDDGGKGEASGLPGIDPVAPGTGPLSGPLKYEKIIGGASLQTRGGLSGSDDLGHVLNSSYGE